jgi:AP-1 complex subunit mu
VFVRQQLTNKLVVCLAVHRCHFNLPSVEAEEETHSKLPPIKVKFEIPYFTVSGMQVRAWRVL